MMVGRLTPPHKFIIGLVEVLMAQIKKIFKMREIGVLIPLLLLWLVTYIVNHAFLSSVNMIALFRSVSITLLGTIGAAFVFSCGMMDVSSGSIYALSGMIAGLALRDWGLSTPIAILAGLCVGLVFGLFNGFIVNKFDLPPFIATLGTQYVARGLCNVVTSGKSITGFPDSFKALGSFGPFHIPWSIYISIVFAIVAFVVFKYSILGRSLLAVGGNKETARLCGINVRFVSSLSFVISGVFCSLAGILSTARLETAQAAAASGWEMTCIAAAIIGGVSMFGGSVTIAGAIIGACLMETLNISMTMLKVNAFWQKVAIGIVIILAVGIDTYRRKKMSGGK